MKPSVQGIDKREHPESSGYRKEEEAKYGKKNQNKQVTYN